MTIKPGNPYPLGATFDGTGTNFAIFSRTASAVDLCLFDEQSGQETRIPLTERDNHIWHGYVPNVFPGQKYGFRLDGDYDPARGLTFNHSKLLLDPYATAISGRLKYDESLYSYNWDDPEHTAGQNHLDSATSMLRSVVTDPYFDWGNDRRPETPFSDSVIYEAHVRGMTMLNPAVPSKIRGTFAGMADPSVIEYFKELGVTAVEILPSQQFISEPPLHDKGLRNYWGYNTIGFFAPYNGYSSTGDTGQQVTEFKSMVKAYHRAGLEIIMDVVYNHTGEGNALGPTLCFKGVDNPTYYRLVPGDNAHYFDTTGCGNSLNMHNPQTLRLVTDSLRYWAQEMHVDGFRFDLAPTLGRGQGYFDKYSAFFDMIDTDPLLSHLKLIAEPWDCGENGYQVGGFPVNWSEWNGQYRDAARDFWRSQTSTLPVFASRITGSSDLYQANDRKPQASVNFITAHDGFTLRDLVSYNDKHNYANGEDNRDGDNNNRSWNCGAEGETDDPEILALRDRQERNFIATLMVSQGVPMICGGDEIGRTQQGNNNAYCQDNGTSWYNWDLTERDKTLLRFTAKMIRLRREHPALHRSQYFASYADDHDSQSIKQAEKEAREHTRIRTSNELQDTQTARMAFGQIYRTMMQQEAAQATAQKAAGSHSARILPQIEWFDHTGQIMNQRDWDNMYALSLMIFLNGERIPERDANGKQKTDNDLLLLFNAYHESIDFTLPTSDYGKEWEVAVDTFDPDAPAQSYDAGATLEVQPYSFLLLEATDYRNIGLKDTLFSTTALLEERGN